MFFGIRSAFRSPQFLIPAIVAAGSAVILASARPAHAETLRYTVTCTVAQSVNVVSPPHTGTTVTTQDSSQPLNVWNSCYIQGEGLVKLQWTITVQNLTNSIPFNIWTTSKIQASCFGNSTTPADSLKIDDGLDSTYPTYTFNYPNSITGNVTSQPVSVVYVGAAQNPASGSFYQYVYLKGTGGPANFYVTLNPKADPLTP